MWMEGPCDYTSCRTVVLDRFFDCQKKSLSRGTVPHLVIVSELEATGNHIESFHQELFVCDG